MKNTGEGRLEVTAIENGTVIDHIPASNLFKIIRILAVSYTHLVRRNGEYQQPVVLPLPSGAGNAAQVRFIVRVQLAKTGEILFSRQQGLSLIHI